MQDWTGIKPRLTAAGCLLEVLPPMPGHLCLLWPLLSLCAAPLGPLAGWWWLSAGGTWSPPLSASPRFPPPSAGQKKHPHWHHSIHTSSLREKDSAQQGRLCQDTAWAHHKSIWQSRTLGILWKKKRKKKGLHCSPRQLALCNEILLSFQQGKHHPGTSLVYPKASLDLHIHVLSQAFPSAQMQPHIPDPVSQISVFPWDILRGIPWTYLGISSSTYMKSSAHKRNHFILQQLEFAWIGRFLDIKTFKSSEQHQKRCHESTPWFHEIN